MHFSLSFLCSLFKEKVTTEIIFTYIYILHEIIFEIHHIMEWVHSFN